jgi:hypothetical protein
MIPMETEPSPTREDHGREEISRKSTILIIKLIFSYEESS